MLALVPGTRTAPGTGANTGPRIQSRARPTERRHCARTALRRIRRLARSRLARRRLHPPHPAARRHQAHRRRNRRTAAHHPHDRHAGPVDLQGLRKPASRHLPRLRRDLPPRCLPHHPRRADRRQRRHPGRRRTPGRVRHLHRPVLRPGPRPPGPPAHLHGQGPLPAASPSPATPAATQTKCEHGRPTACFTRHTPR